MTFTGRSRYVVWVVQAAKLDADELRLFSPLSLASDHPTCKGDKTDHWPDSSGESKKQAAGQGRRMSASKLDLVQMLRLGRWTSKASP